MSEPLKVHPIVEFVAVACNCGSICLASSIVTGQAVGEAVQRQFCRFKKISIQALEILSDI